MKTIISINPANQKILGTVKVTSRSEVIKKVQNAKRAAEPWKTIGVDKRCGFLQKFIEQLQNNKERIALLETQEMGMPLTQSRFDVDEAIRYFGWYISEGKRYCTPQISYDDKTTRHTIYYEPCGVAAVISPWNFPISNFVWGVAANLLVGNTVVFKHSEECPLVGKLIEELMDSCNFPDGVFAEVYGDAIVGQQLVNEEIDLICFTGSSATGQKLYATAAKKFIKIVMELGGSAPGIILADADVDTTVEQVYNARFWNAGQICDGLKRLIVHEKIFDQVIDRLRKMLDTKIVGDPERESTDIGPLVSKRQKDFLKQQITDAIHKGAKVWKGTKSENKNGFYVEPLLLTNIKPKMKVWSEEVFGPVLPIISFSTNDQAIELANQTSYGLGAYIFTRNKKMALELAEKSQTGMVSINGVSYVTPQSPFGGTKGSGLGREHGEWGIREVCQIKVIAQEK